jgi:tRNA(Ile)-lysidine synthase TilS/MesJ
MPSRGCSRCGRDAIILQRYSGLRLCGDHFRENLEARAKRTLRAHGGIRPGDRIAVGLSGGAASSSLLPFLSAHFGMRRDLSFIAITVDEGTGTRRDMAAIRTMAEGTGIPWAAGSLAGEAGLPGPVPDEGTAGLPPACIARLRDHALGSLARRVGATKLALGKSLDDEARSVLLHVLRGEGCRLLRRPPSGPDAIPRIMPFLRIPGAELSLYARLAVPGFYGGDGPLSPDSLEEEVRRCLDEFTCRHPSAPFSLAGLGEGLSGAGGVIPPEPNPCGACGESPPPGCPARRVHGRVLGHG